MTLPNPPSVNQHLCCKGQVVWLIEVDHKDIATQCLNTATKDDNSLRKLKQDQVSCLHDGGWEDMGLLWLIRSLHRRGSGWIKVQQS